MHNELPVNIVQVCRIQYDNAVFNVSICIMQCIQQNDAVASHPTSGKMMQLQTKTGGCNGDADALQGKAELVWAAGDTFPE